MSQFRSDIIKLTLPTPFAVGDVHAYLLKGDVLTLVDTGTKTEKSRQALELGLKMEGYQLSDIEQVLITHHHPDHAGGVDFLSPDLPFIGHANNQRWLTLSEEFLQEHDEFFYSLSKTLGVPSEFIGFIKYLRHSLKYSSARVLSSCLQDGEAVPGHPGWRVIETLGHAQSHISLYRESDGRMIGGDHLLAKISPNPLLEPPLVKGEERPKSLLQYNQSIKELYDLPISLVYPGHGENITDVQELISRNLNRQHERAMNVKEMIKTKPSTAFEICTKLFPKVFMKEPGLTLSETIGQLDYLLDREEIRLEETDTGIIYTLNNRGQE
ncbi:glyoxylase-like metal-dependent hydrolase (beta-lactamase superfamily II) [Peribacillus deserti]|uniref:Glyoxylase-like metal-dependent hydrolase (Beta-lactamase superfamily II) n=1 Tax=Peribacillus deserti TaxID=673318 RepID=A0ABS2QJS5_9BACI|nr:MBL fold metallo-hydrolase [Peribacillus deserti]MBM7693205.1 glyoxylase-like metal-dependent hydrolase (beta-lactamase superfamily II) [Peribacillus deserti]